MQLGLSEINWRAKGHFLKTIYSILLLVIASLMAILFGPLGLLPFVYLLVVRSTSKIEISNNILGIQKIKTDRFLFIYGGLSILFWYFIKYIIEEKSLIHLFSLLSERVLLRTSAVDNFLKSESSISLDYIGIQAVSIIIILITGIFSIIFKKEKIFSSMIKNQKKIIDDYGLNNSIKSRYVIFLIYSLFIIVNFVPYIAIYKTVAEDWMFIYLKYIAFSAFLYPAVILFNVLSIVIWTRNSKINGGDDLE